MIKPKFLRCNKGVQINIYPVNTVDGIQPPLIFSLNLSIGKKHISGHNDIATL